MTVLTPKEGSTMTAGYDLELTINDQPVAVRVAPTLRLVDLLRDVVGLTGTHLACGEGPCGACTVLVDGQTARSCLMLAVQAEGRSVETIESVGTPDAMHPVQLAFQNHHALQCGFCTPGLIMSSVALFRRNPTPSREEIATMLQGHLCRCTGYLNIIAALEDVAGLWSPPIAGAH
jgi:aerobic-type carbon monoxide dehydrogenase small subunit (CoxS/CutS family)